VSRIPWRIVGYVLAAVIALAAVNHFAGFIPFTPQWSEKRATVKAERLEAEVSVLQRVAIGQAEITTATDTYHTRTVVVQETTAAAITDARSAADADTPLDNARADRLRAHDRSLCDASPGLCADPDLAGSVPRPVPAAGTAR